MELLSLLLLLVPLGVMALLAFYVLWPMVAVLKDNRFTAIPRIYVIDIVSLLVLLQISMALLGMELYWAAIPLAVAVLYAWWRGAGVLSKLGIRDSRRRAVFLMFVMPWAILGSLVEVVVGIVALISLVEWDHDDSEVVTVRIWLLTAFLGSSALFPLARWLNSWVVAGSGTAATTRNSVAATPPPATARET